MKLKTLMQALREAARQAGHSNPEVILVAMTARCISATGATTATFFMKFM